MSPDHPEAVLDDTEAIEAADPGQMLRAVASSGAQVRESTTRSAESGLHRLAEDGRPRSVLVAGMGGSAVAGDVLAAVAGSSCPAAVSTHRGYTLPGWVGPVDLVVAVSCSGSTEETLALAEQAVRRGCRLLTVGPPESMLAAVSEQARGVHVPVDAHGRSPRANLWALSVPLLVAADRLGLAHVPADVLGSAADLLDVVADRCRPASDAFVNPAKVLALELAGTLPMLWGSSDLAGVAAYRFACQLAENAKCPAVYGVLPEANHNQVVSFDGPYAGSGVGGGDDDLFRDRVDDADPVTRLRLILLRDTDEHPQVVRRREVSAEIAARRGVQVSGVVAEGSHPLERLASLVAVTDYASVYLALALGIDPTPIDLLTELKQRIAR